MLLEVIKNEWENISIEQYKKLTDSMPKRIALHKKAYGEAIPY